MLSDLPRDLAEEVLSRVPVTSMRAVRFVSKKWNTLCKDESFTKKHFGQAKAAAAAREFMVVMVINCQVYLMSVNNLNGIHEHNVEPSINCQAKLVSLTDSDRDVVISDVYHCDGLLLCIAKDCTRFVVWNPYCGQTLWFEPGVCLSRYAIGYENTKSSCRSYKVLRFRELTGYVTYEIFYMNSKSSRFFTIFAYWVIQHYARGLTLKGNTYWYAQQNVIDGRGERIPKGPDFLICFDFTTERFGQRLPLPFDSFHQHNVTLSNVRDEQLAVLFVHRDNVEIWITSKIDPQTVSWSPKKLLFSIDSRTLVGLRFPSLSESFFVDEEKKVVVVFDQDIDMPERYIAFIIGEDGIFKKVHLEGAPNYSYHPCMCSYVPSLEQIK